MSIEVGRFWSNDALWRWFYGNGGECDFLAGMTSSCPVAKVMRTINLVAVSARDLGFEDKATYKQILVRGLRVGLEGCPEEAAFIARIEYRNQPAGECLRFVSKVVEHIYGGLQIFNVETLSSGKPLLGASEVFTASLQEPLFDPDDIFVFALQ